MKVTKTSHPRLYRAFVTIMLDNGAINRMRPQQDAYEMNLTRLELEYAEDQLTRMTYAERKILCTGEVDDQLAIAKKHRAGDVHRLLKKFFRTI